MVGSGARQRFVPRHEVAALRNAARHEQSCSTREIPTCFCRSKRR